MNLNRGLGCQAYVNLGRDLCVFDEEAVTVVDPNVVTVDEPDAWIIGLEPRVFGLLLVESILDVYALDWFDNIQVQ